MRLTRTGCVWLLLVGQLVLISCGGGSDESAPLFEVKATQEASGAVTASYRDGDTAAIEVETDETVKFESSKSVEWESSVSGAELVVVENRGTLRRLKLKNSAAAAASAVFRIYLRDEPSKSLQLTVNTRPTPYAGRSPSEEGSSTWDSRRSFPQSSAHEDVVTTTEVSADGSGFVATTRMSWGDSSSQYKTEFIDNDGRILSRRHVWLSQNPDYADPERTCDYSRGIALYRFPLRLGDHWNDTFRSSCGSSYDDIVEKDVSIESTVEAYEPVTVPAGTFDSLRVRTVLSPGDETITWNSPFSTRETRVCWWAVELRREIKCDIRYSYENVNADGVGLLREVRALKVVP